MPAAVSPVALPGHALRDGRPVLDLSGPKLRRALETLVRACEEQGGVEAFAAVLKLKSQAFQTVLVDEGRSGLDLDRFGHLVRTMATVRRRVASLVQAVGWSQLRSSVAGLLEGAHDTATADRRMAAFCSGLAGDGRATRECRFVRDLAAEILHNVLPEQYPLMHRWVWDSRANTGVLREELSQFLADNGVFRDMLWYVDLLQAQVYAGYINAQGGAYLRTDFACEGDPLEQTRRLLGIDGVGLKSSRSLVTTLEGAATSSEPPQD